MVVLKLLAILSGVITLFYAMILARRVLSENPGSEIMVQLSHSIEKGAMTFLKREYSFLLIFVLVVAVVIVWVRGSVTGLSFIVGALCSALTGFIGMKVATKSNARTTFAAQESGMSKALKIAFSGGAVMGLSVAGFGLVGLGILYYFFDDPNLINGFALGASSIALFARVGGGIFTKAADVGADLVGKIEAGIPEDDPRNPAVIADNVGDNVGDVAGMGADLFESFVGSIVSTMILGSLLYNSVNYIIYPLILVACGAISVVIATFFVAPKDDKNIHNALNMGTYVSGILVTISSLVLSL
ncbi:MAG TPA: sodium/proton-translocating pyrophosphatase, partial [Atribacterota bacterium]|nr:sodium/proton-translocating pyrophosphatase [Atribacterota bacterium]